MLSLRWRCVHWTLGGHCNANLLRAAVQRDDHVRSQLRWRRRRRRGRRSEGGRRWRDGRRRERGGGIEVSAQEEVEGEQREADAGEQQRERDEHRGTPVQRALSAAAAPLLRAAPLARRESVQLDHCGHAGRRTLLRVGRRVRAAREPGAVAGSGRSGGAAAHEMRVAAFAEVALAARAEPQRRALLRNALRRPRRRDREVHAAGARVAGHKASLLHASGSDRIDEIFLPTAVSIFCAL